MYHITGWFKTMQYEDKRAIPISNLVETTYFNRNNRPTEIMYDQVSELIVNSFIKSLIE